MSKKKNNNGITILDGLTKEQWETIKKLSPDEETAALSALYFVLDRRGLVVDNIMFLSKETKNKYLNGENVEVVNLYE